MSETGQKLPRAELAQLWQSRLQMAEDRYILAAAQFQKAMKEQRDGLAPAPDGTLALRKARSRESSARREYMRVLRVFTDLTVGGKIPEE